MDIDRGIDDALGIMLAAASSKVDLRASWEWRGTSSWTGPPRTSETNCDVAMHVGVGRFREPL